MKKNIVTFTIALMLVGSAAFATYLSGLKGVNGGLITNNVDNAFRFYENSEDLVLTFGSNSAVWSSATGVASFGLGALPLGWTNGGSINNTTDGALTFGETSEDLVLTFGSNSATLSSTTGVAALSLGALPLTWTNGAQIHNTTDGAITMSEASEDLVTTFTSNTATTTSTTGVDTLAYTGIGLTTNTTIKCTSATNIGWSVVAGANTACNTTCTNACVVGFDDGAADAENMVDCADATADKCLCAGAN